MNFNFEIDPEMDYDEDDVYEEFSPALDEAEIDVIEEKGEFDRHIMRAIRRNNHAQLERLMRRAFEKFGDSASRLSNVYGYDCVLHAAVLLGRVECAQVLLSFEQINAVGCCNNGGRSRSAPFRRNQTEGSALRVAVCQTSMEHAGRMAKLLIAHGAVDNGSSAGSLLCAAFMRRNCTVELAEALLDTNNVHLQFKGHFPHLYAAAFNHDGAVVLRRVLLFETDNDMLLDTACAYEVARDILQHICHAIERRNFSSRIHTPFKLNTIATNQEPYQDPLLDTTRNREPHAPTPYEAFSQHYSAVVRAFFDAYKTAIIDLDRGIGSILLHVLFCGFTDIAAEMIGEGVSLLPPSLSSVCPPLCAAIMSPNPESFTLVMSYVTADIVHAYNEWSQQGGQQGSTANSPLCIALSQNRLDRYQTLLELGFKFSRAVPVNLSYCLEMKRTRSSVFATERHPFLLYTQCQLISFMVLAIEDDNVLVTALESVLSNPSLIDSLQIDLKATNEGEMPPLVALACREWSADNIDDLANAVNLLLNHGANPFYISHRNPFDCPDSIILALLHGNVTCLKFLISKVGGFSTVTVLQELASKLTFSNVLRQCSDASSSYFQRHGADAEYQKDCSRMGNAVHGAVKLLLTFTTKLALPAHVASLLAASSLSVSSLPGPLLAVPSLPGPHLAVPPLALPPLAAPPLALPPLAAPPLAASSLAAPSLAAPPLAASSLAAPPLAAAIRSSLELVCEQIEERVRPHMLIWRSWRNVSQSFETFDTLKHRARVAFVQHLSQQQSDPAKWEMLAVKIDRLGLPNSMSDYLKFDEE